ncbi:hypothetical protein [Cryptosporangium arvum]|uniref:Uncharacterized protein n=1 Tax=Cryptosporangium arvum DSM 44712 TaxID=927661 RepID=A0A010YIE6_9ACTN|nr:hypothetical protein [Cryptosporangium arvum]EXG80035.1 hypothetical protein CryarDRAFT_1094 [Cryptosporangium arvum DSM 44712]
MSRFAYIVLDRLVDALLAAWRRSGAEDRWIGYHQARGRRERLSWPEYRTERREWRDAMAAHEGEPAGAVPGPWFFAALLAVLVMVAGYFGSAAAGLISVASVMVSRRALTGGSPRFEATPATFAGAIIAESERQLAAWKALPPGKRRSAAEQDAYLDGLFAAIAVIEETTGRDLLGLFDPGPEVSGQPVTGRPVSAPSGQVDGDLSHPVPPARSADRGA